MVWTHQGVKARGTAGVMIFDLGAPARPSPLKQAVRLFLLALHWQITDLLTLLGLQDCRMATRPRAPEHLLANPQQCPAPRTAESGRCSTGPLTTVLLPETVFPEVLSARSKNIRLVEGACPGQRGDSLGGRPGQQGTISGAGRLGTLIWRNLGGPLGARY